MLPLVIPIDDSGKIVYYSKPKPKPQPTQVTEPPPVKLWQPAPPSTTIYETKKIVVPDKSTPNEKPKSKIKYYERDIIMLYVMPMEAMILFMRIAEG